MKPASKKFSRHADALASDCQKIQNAFADTAVDVTDMAEDMCNLTADNLKDQADDIQQRMTDYAVKNPMRTLSIALVAGLVIGWWLKR